MSYYAGNITAEMATVLRKNATILICLREKMEVQFSFFFWGYYRFSLRPLSTRDRGTNNLYIRTMKRNTNESRNKSSTAFFDPFQFFLPLFSKQSAKIPRVPPTSASPSS